MARRRRRGPVTATVGWGHRSPQKTQKATDTTITTTTTSLVFGAPSGPTVDLANPVSEHDAPQVRPQRPETPGLRRYRTPTGAVRFAWCRMRLYPEFAAGSEVNGSVGEVVATPNAECGRVGR